jgi:hypothetical protein
MKAPFPYFGGKGRIADAVWARFGRVRNYVEPFFGSGAVLLRRPTPFDGTETVNDADALLCNFWRSVAADPDAVAEHASWPVIENDLHARHAWLVGRKDALQARLEGDPEYYDAKVAGWWCWGACCWIGGGWCSGAGPWQVVADVDGIPRLEVGEAAGPGIQRRRVAIQVGGPGHGVNASGVKRNRVHLGNAGQGVTRASLDDAGQGVNASGVSRRRVHPGNDQGVTVVSSDVRGLMHALADRLRRVRVCCGDWSRVCGPTPTTAQGLTAVFLDPPYSAEAGRDNDIYRVENPTVAHDAREWAIAQGADPMLRIALCGYEGEHALPDDWACLAWKTSGGYGSRGERGAINARRERVWFSPHCINPEDDMPLFRRDGAFFV